MKYIDLHERNFKYDPAIHTDDEMRRAINQLFGHVYTDLAAGCSQRDLNKHFESKSLPAFIDYLGDTLYDCGVPEAKRKEIKDWCRKGREPNRFNTNDPKVFTFKEFTR